jgi:nitrous oxide reductase accessory protein NosL
VGFIVLLAGVAALAFGCRPKGERGRKCGMLVNQAPRWIAGLTNSTGAQERFCCERCMFAHLRSPEGAEDRNAWVTEYYTQRRMPVGEVLFVMGSDVTGPMGKALVPIAGRAQAELFMKDHYGSRILTADEITLEVLREVAGKPAAPK